MNNRFHKKMRAMAGYEVNATDENGDRSTRYQVTPNSQRQKEYTVGINADGTERKSGYTTATFMMKDCPRKMAKVLAKRLKPQHSQGTGKAKKGGFKSRQGKPSTSMARSQCPKPQRCEVTAYNWLLHGMGLSFCTV